MSRSIRESRKKPASGAMMAMASAARTSVVDIGTPSITVTFPFGENGLYDT
jgi:hypothetical protein